MERNSLSTTHLLLPTCCLRGARGYMFMVDNQAIVLHGQISREAMRKVRKAATHAKNMV